MSVFVCFPNYTPNFYQKLYSMANTCMLIALYRWYEGTGMFFTSSRIIDRRTYLDIYWSRKCWNQEYYSKWNVSAVELSTLRFNGISLVLFSNCYELLTPQHQLNTFVFMFVCIFVYIVVVNYSYFRLIYTNIKRALFQLTLQLTLYFLKNKHHRC